MARVLWLIKGLGLGGAEQLLASLAPHVDRSRFAYEAAFLLPWKTALVEDLERVGIPTTCLGHRHPFDLRVIWRVARLLRERHVEILHLHLPYSGIIGRLAARLAGVPWVVYTEHNLQERYHPLTRLANQLTLRLCDVTIAVSEEVRASLLRSRFARAARVLTIPNGVDVDALRRAAEDGRGVRQELGIQAGAPIVGVVNVLRPQKRLDLWLEAAGAIAAAEPTAVFVVVGHGPQLEELAAQAARAGLNGRLMFTGLRRDAPRLMAAFDVFMLSSEYEGLPVAILEAMALRRAIVATRVGGLPDAIRDGREGLLVPSGDAAALADRVLLLLRRPALRATLGEAAGQRVAEAFGIDRMARRVEAVYEEIQAGEPRSMLAHARPD